MVGDMTDENDLDEFARLFGAQPETPPDGLLPAAEARPTAPADAGAGAAGAPRDPLAWLLSDGTAEPTAAFPSPSLPSPPQPPTSAFDTTQSAPTQPHPAAYPAPTAHPTATATALADPTQVLPTRRSLAAEAARASRESGRRNLIILGGISALVLVLIVVLVVVLVSKNASSGSPDALLKQPASSPASATPAASTTPTPTPTPTPTVTPTPTPVQVQTAAPPPPVPPTVTATVLAQPNCPAGTTATTISIGYTSTNAATLNLSSTDSTVPGTNITPSASGTISSVLYHCGLNASYTLTVYSSAEGVTPGTATVTPEPTNG
jgi:hypothetical protein